MTKKQIAELVRICDCKEIQKLWKPKIGQEVWDITEQRIRIIIRFDCYDWFNIEDGSMVITEERKQYIWLPRIEDVIKIVGDKFKWISFDGNRFEVGSTIGNYINKSARIACIKATIAVLKGDK